MDYRIGNCSSCGAVYKVPASFAHDTAKCKECGGAVRIGPIQSGDLEESGASATERPTRAQPPKREPQKSEQPSQPPKSQPPTAGARRTGAPEPRSEPAAKVPPVPAERYEEVPARPKKRSGPSMKEQILARRRAEGETEAQAGHGTTPASPAKRPAAARPSSPRAAAPAAKAAHANRTVSRSGGASRRGAASRSSSRTSGRSSGGRGSRDGARGSKREGKKNPLPALLGILGIVAVLAAAFWVFREDFGLVSPPETTGVLAAEGGAEADAPGTAAATETPEAGAEAGEPEAAAPEPQAEGTEGADGAEAAAAGATPPGATPPGEEAPAEEAAPAEGAPGEGAPAEGVAGAGEDAAEAPPAAESSATAEEDAEALDLSTLPVWERARGTTDEEWQELNAKVETFLDLGSGAASSRARRHLVEAGRKAFPVLLNAARGLDLTTEEGGTLGDLVQRSLTDICNGINFSWKYGGERKDAVFNAKVFRLWAKEWGKATEDIEAWIRMSKLDEKDPEEAARLRELYGTAEPDSDDEAGLEELDDSLDDF